MSTKRSAKTAAALADLPPNILIEIIVRLPLRTIFVSRSICKTFLSLTTPDPHFTDLHASNAAQILVFQFGGSSDPSYLLRLAEPELDIAALRNPELRPLFLLPKMGTSINLYRTNFREENRFFLVNSCNGLVFFSRRLAGDERSLVCNPVTNEYVLIPEVDRKIRFEKPTKSLWLGFSPGTDRYKVLRVLGSKDGDPAELAAQVFVIGSESWRDVDDTPSQGHIPWDLCSTVVNGVIYWLDQLWTLVLTFDFEREKFEEVALPTEFQEEQFRNKHYSSIGVLGGCLCLSINYLDAQRVDLWVMRKCGNRDCWRKEFVVDTLRPTCRPVRGQLKPLQFLRNGEIVMLWMGKDLVCYDPITQSLRYVFGLHRLKLAHKAVTLTPSFVPLKDTLKVERVFNRYTRPRGDEMEP